MSKKLKRFSLDQQQIFEPNIHRSSMGIAPNHGVQINTNPIFKPVRDESNNDLQQQRSKVILRKFFQQKINFLFLF
jgi:hypothetical protein